MRHGIAEAASRTNDRSFAQNLRELEKESSGFYMVTMNDLRGQDHGAPPGPTEEDLANTFEALNYE